MKQPYYYWSTIMSAVVWLSSVRLIFIYIFISPERQHKW